MKKLIPPLLFVLCVLGMVTAKYILPTQDLIKYPFNLIGVILIIVGIALTVIVRKQFEKLNTEIHTFKTPRILVTNGLFKRSRNPIYLGFVIALIGIWLTLNNVVSGIPVMIFIIITNFWYIPYEEEQMTKEFGKDYENYRSKTRRWI